MNMLLFLLAGLFTTLCEGARILVLPYNARSHFIVIHSLILALHERGHHITVVSSLPQTTPMENYKDIDFSHQFPVNNYSFVSIKQKMPNMFKTSIFITEIHFQMCENILGDEQLLSVLEEKFDLVIGETFGSDCFNYIAHKLKVPFINFMTSTSLPWLADRTGLPDNPSYIPNYFVEFGADMNFFQRLFNTITLMYAKAVYYYFSEIPSHQLAEDIFDEKFPSMNEVNQQTSLVLLNSHFSLSQSRPITPNVVEVGGIHIKEPQPLPQYLRELLDNAKDGVILFNFGSLVKTSSLPPGVIRMFLDVFATIPQRVIFKYEEGLPDAPPNVIIRDWLPQIDIIAHPNVRAMITHCGLASTIEAVHFAKPLVAVPLFADQFKNAKNVVRRGGGILLDIDNLSRQDIIQAIKAVLENPSYKSNMLNLSQQFRDRPMTPLQTAVYWTEYVIRHQGAPHLQPASVHLPLFQYLLLDVIAVLIISLAAVLFVLYFIICLIWAMVCGGRNTTVDKQNVKNSKKIN